MKNNLITRHEMSTNFISHKVKIQVNGGNDRVPVTAISAFYKDKT